MSKAQITIWLSLLWMTSLGATDIIFQSRSATALNGVALFPDSTFEKASMASFQEGELFEVLGESVLQHEDNAQNQKFKWYQVRCRDGRTGWIFGEGLAVIVPDDSIDEKLRLYHKRDIRLNNGFEKAVMWIAGIAGRDNIHSQDFLNPTHKELYLVITNERGRSVHLNISGESAMGHTTLHDLRLYDTTGDGIPEILIQTGSFSLNDQFEHRNFGIYSLQAGILTQLLEEYMSLNYQEDIPSPALFRQIEVDQQIVRIAYVDYLQCSDYRLAHDPKASNKHQERCLEYVTYTYRWDEKARRYQMIYEESRSALRGEIRTDNVVLRTEPSVVGQRLGSLAKQTPVDVIKHFERITIVNDQSKIIPYLYIRLADGTYGYLLAETVSFPDVEHGHVLRSYYQKQPLSKLDWKTNHSFLKIVPDPRSSYSGK